MYDNALSVAYFGGPGSYSHQAAAIMFPSSTLQGARNFKDVVGMVDDGSHQFAVIPVENSIGGHVRDVHNLLLTTELSVVSEYMLHIEHMLVTGSDEPLDVVKSRIEVIHSHQQAITQCSRFLQATYPNAKIVYSDTSEAAQISANEADSKVAAITSRKSVELYGCTIVNENIADVAGNYTRFLVLSPVRNNARSDQRRQHEGPDDITTLIFQVPHEPGALLRALKAFDDNKINMLTLFTYNISTKTARPTFYVDAGKHIKSPAMQQALQQLGQHAPYIKLLGSYPASKVRGEASGFLAVDG